MITPYNCGICRKLIATYRFVIRDDQPETKFQWWWRHVKGILTFKIWGRRKFAVIIPVCDSCISTINKVYYKSQ